MSHDHDRAGHGYGHGPRSFGAAFAIGAALNLGFVVVEGAYGMLARPMAHLADAGHNPSDVLGIIA